VCILLEFLQKKAIPITNMVHDDIVVAVSYNSMFVLLTIYNKVSCTITSSRMQQLMNLSDVNTSATFCSGHK